ncbi:MAG: DUF86 domain-containing protein [Desulfobacterales bacterium]|nr:MAG: DUF86 domain-containing protein [Desulfobacterales bacterium]
MLDHANEAVSLVSGKEKTDLQKNRLLELALTRLIEIVGEAAAKVNSDIQAKYPSIPWSQIIGMRNRLIHGYDTVDVDILWDTIEVDLPPLISELKKILNKAGNKNN